MAAVERDEPLIHHHFRGLEPAIDIRLFPAPLVGERYAGECRKIATLWHPLTGVLFVNFDVRVIETAGRIARSVEITDEAMRLQRLYVVVDRAERDLFIADTGPRRVPSVGDEDVNLTIVGEQFGELVLDELDLFRGDIEVPDI